MTEVESISRQLEKPALSTSEAEAEARRITKLLRKGEARWVRKVRLERGPICEDCGVVGVTDVFRRVELFQLVLGLGFRTRREGLACVALWDTRNGRVLCKTCSTVQEQVHEGSAGADGDPLLEAIKHDRIRQSQP